MGQRKRKSRRGARNLAKWKAENPDVTPALKHGAYSAKVHQRYRDHRYREAKQLRGIMTGLVADLGGQPNLTEAQRLLLANIRSKLIVLLQIGKYVERQDSIINTEGELIPCLGRNYTAFAEAIRRDLLALGQLGNRTGDKIPTIAEIIAGGKE